MKKFYLIGTICLAMLFPFTLGAQCGAFTDGFESGTSTAWTTEAGSYTRTVITGSAPVGTYHFEQTGGSSSHLNGVSASFTNAQPTEISWHVKTSNPSNASGYVVIGENGFTSASNCVCFFYFTQGNICVYVNGSTQYNQVAVANQWYNIELRNINYTAKTYDLYVDNILVSSGFPFRNTSLNGVGAVHLYNFQTATAGWDDVIVGGANITPNLTSTDPLCNGGATGSASVAPTGGSAYAYLWSTGDTSSTVSNLAAGTYTVTIADANNLSCSTSTSVTIADPSAIAVTPSLSEPLCNGDQTGGISTSVSGGTAGYTYLWSNGDTSGAISGIGAGVYTLTVQDANNCTGTDSIVLTEPTAISASIVGTDVTCPGGADGAADLTLSGGTPGYSYSWNTGATTEDISGLGAGNYIITAMDSNNCMFMDTIIISAPAPFSYVDSVIDVACNGDMNGIVDVVVSGANGGYSYAWSTGDTSSSIFGVSGGTYTLTVTDASNCTSTTTYTVAEPAAIATSGVVTDDVGGANIGSIDYAISGGAGGFTFSWSNGETTEDITGLAGGTYIVTATDANGCMVMDTFIVESLVSVANGIDYDVNLFPNPTESDVVLSIAGLNADQLNLQVMDLNGRILHSELVDAPANNFRHQMNFADYPAGVYFIQLQSADWARTLKVVRR